MTKQAMPLDYIELLKYLRNRVLIDDRNIVEVAECVDCAPLTLKRFVDGITQTANANTIDGLIREYLPGYIIMPGKRPAPSMAFSDDVKLPEGWRVHPTHPRYAYKDQTVKLISDLVGSAGNAE